MISSSITGSVGGSNQLFELLSLVSDPEAYAEKVRALEEATAENKKYVELVAPASDIISLREKAQIDRKDAAYELAEAQRKAEEIINAAKQEAAEIKASAHRFANDTKAIAENMLSDVSAKKSELDRAEKEAKNAMAENKRSTTILRKATEEAKAAKDAADAARSDYEAIKNEIIAKHRAFIESL